MEHSPDLIPDIDIREFLLWIFRRRYRFTVAGASMFPILKPGDQVLIDRSAYRRNVPVIGDIVVARHPDRDGLKVIKRITKIHSDGSINLEGENIFETTNFRRVSAVKIVGKVTSVFYRANQADK